MKNKLIPFVAFVTAFAPAIAMAQAPAAQVRPESMAYAIGMGLAIGLAAMGSYALVRGLSGFCWRHAGRCNHHVLATMVALLAALIYVQISGLALPARRAGLMLCLAGLFALHGRRRKGF